MLDHMCEVQHSDLLNETTKVTTAGERCCIGLTGHYLFRKYLLLARNLLYLELCQAS